MKKSVFVSALFLGLFSFSAIAQNFPPPTNLIAIAPDDLVILYWSPPQDATPAYYKIYRSGCPDLIYLPIDSTPDTVAHIYPVFLGYCEYFKVTAVYQDPDGESYPEGPAAITCSPQGLPFEEGFESIPVFMNHNVLLGTNDWTIIDSAAHTGQSCAHLPATASAGIAQLSKPSVEGDTNYHVNVGFWAKVPSWNGSTDTLKVIGAGNQLGVIHSVNDWTYYDFLFLSPTHSTGVTFEGVSANGNGVYLDDLNIESEFTGVDETNTDNNQVIIFPNPAKDEVFVRIENGKNEPVLIALYDLSGKCVKKVQESQGTLKIEVGDLQPGLYVLSVRMAGISYRQKLIIGA